MAHHRKLQTLFFLPFLLVAQAASDEVPRKTAIHYADLQPDTVEALSRRGISKKNFDDFVQSLNRLTAQRERAGEIDQLVYYLLQSQRFTRQPRIEPALSAREFVEKLSPEDRASYLKDRPPYLPPIENLPQSVALRVQDFVQALGQPDSSASDERLLHFKQLLRRDNIPPNSWPRVLYADYARLMKFLYRKEFQAESLTPADKGPFLAGLYQSRGHSTETRIEANYSVWTALSVLKALEPGAQINSVLIVGPGLDSSPRTDLADATRPQSYQPYAVADAVLGLGLSDPSNLRIQCVDINDRVIRFLTEFPKSHFRRLTILSTFQRNSKNLPTKDFRIYFDKLGKHAGAEVPADPALKNEYLKKSLLVRQDVADKITAEKLNIITERYVPSPQYDLVVATNVLLYFNPTELLLALNNIHSMLRPGGYMIHNELRPELERIGITLGLPTLQARSLRLSSNEENPLLDGFVILKRSF